MKFDGFGRIGSQNSGKVLDVAGESVDSGAVIHQWTTVNDARNQLFRL